MVLFWVLFVRVPSQRTAARARSSCRLYHSMMVNGYGQRAEQAGICDWISKSDRAREPSGYEHKDRPKRPTEHAYGGIRRHLHPRRL